MKVLELGGGSFPFPGVTCNVDARMCHDAAGNPTVSFTADFEQPLPITSDEWDVVINRFCAEHLSWRKIRGFLSEIHRILKPGGIAHVITANLYEQAKMLIAAEDEGRMEDRWVCQLFGDGDYPENFHRNGGGPQWWLQLFQEAGFRDVLVWPLPEWKGDMIVQARKETA